MAEIRIEPKRRSLAWLWILLVLAVIALVAWYLVNQGHVNVQSTDTAPTSVLPTSTPGGAFTLPLALG